MSLEYAWVHQHHGRCRFHWFGQGKDSSGMTRQTPGLVPRLERQHRYLTAKLLACKCKKAVGDLPLFDTFVKYKHFLRRPCSPPWQMWRAVSFPSDFAARAREEVNADQSLSTIWKSWTGASCCGLWNRSPAFDHITTSGWLGTSTEYLVLCPILRLKYETILLVSEYLVAWACAYKWSFISLSYICLKRR